MAERATIELPWEKELRSTVNATLAKRTPEEVKVWEEAMKKAAEQKPRWAGTD
jgi:hypothetical protein